MISGIFEIVKGFEIEYELENYLIVLSAFAILVLLVGNYAFTKSFENQYYNAVLQIADLAAAFFMAITKTLIESITGMVCGY